MGHLSYEQLEDLVEGVKKLIMIGDKYYHYKNPDVLYEIVDIVIIEDSEQVSIVYSNQDHPEVKWVRPFVNFTEKIKTGDKEVPRFSKVS